MNKFYTLLLIFLLFACKTVSTTDNSSSPLSATKSEYLSTSGGGFLLKSGKPMYAMTYTTIKQLPEGTILNVSFENPENPNEPFLSKVTPEGERILIRSKTMSAIKNRTNYKVIVELVQDEQIISTHVQYVRFDMPDAVLNQMGVKTL